MKLRLLLSQKFNYANMKDLVWNELLQGAIKKIDEDPEVLRNCEKKAPALCKLIRFMFPHRDFIQALVEKMQDFKRDELSCEVYSRNYLPFHLRDNEWLTMYLKNTMQNEGQERPYGHEAIVQAHPVFLQERTRYERELAGEIIYFMMHNKKQNALIKTQQVSDTKNLMEFDKNFRQQTRQTLQNLGFDNHESEVLIELNADKWRRACMSKVFESKFTYTPRTSLIRKAHEQAWLSYREYQYFQKHGTILKELNLVTPNMKLNQKQVSRLKNKLKNFAKIHQRIMLNAEKTNIERTK